MVARKKAKKPVKKRNIKKSVTKKRITVRKKKVKRKVKPRKGLFTPKPVFAPRVPPWIKPKTIEKENIRRMFKEKMPINISKPKPVQRKARVEIITLILSIILAFLISLTAYIVLAEILTDNIIRLGAGILTFIIVGIVSYMILRD